MSLKLAAALGLLLSLGPVAAAQHVILDFEKGYPEDQFYFLTYNAGSAVTLRSNTNGHVGKSTSAAWRTRAEDGGLGYAGFGYLHRVAIPANPFPDLTPYTHLSLWYNNTVPSAGASQVAFRFELHESSVETDPQGNQGVQVWIYESRAVLTTAPGWTRLLIPLAQVAELGAAGFAIPPGGFQGNGVLDLDKIRHWAIVLLIEGQPVGTTFTGTTLFDYLTAETLPVTAAPEEEPMLALALLPAYPNPASAAATLTYVLPRAGAVSLRLYDVLGREAAVLVDDAAHAAGRFEVALDARGLAAGTYVYVLEAAGERLSRRVTVLR